MFKHSSNSLLSWKGEEAYVQTFNLKQIPIYISRKNHQIWLNYLSRSFSHKQKISKLVPTNAKLVSSHHCNA